MTASPEVIDEDCNDGLAVLPVEPPLDRYFGNSVDAVTNSQTNATFEVVFGEKLTVTVSLVVIAVVIGAE